MARTPKRSQDIQPDLDWVPTQAVDNPILNSPYDEPSEYWDYVKADGVAAPVRKAGRRPAAYFFQTKTRGQQLQSELFDAESQVTEQLDKLEIPNRLRKDVGRWRAADYRGASPVTRELFRYWFDPQRSRRLFFCQREAVETIVYLLELGMPGRLGSTKWKTFELDSPLIARLLRGERSELSTAGDENPVRLVDIPADPSLLPLTRLGLRMATGSGKTIVMAMIIAWAFCNRGENPVSTHFPNGVLVCAPNLTVKSRLQVLKPEHPESYYRVFDLVPAKYAPYLQQGKVHVTNWHGFAPKSAHKEGDKSYKVVDKGDEPNEAFAKDRLGELAHRLPILVLNDEGHHCWRPKTKDVKIEAETTEEKKAIEDEVEEARVWLAGLDRINNAGLVKDASGKAARCILATIDLSATPFYLAASGYPEGSPFPWLVTSFGLMDAIESGIVKVPRLPVLDDKNKKDEVGRPDPKYFRLWKHITEKLGKNDRVGKRPKPEALFERSDDALKTLASQWKLAFDEHMRGIVGGSAIPPVMIVVCDNTDLADIVFQKVSGERVQEIVDENGKTRKVTVYEGSSVLPELSNEEGARRTVRIDSRLLDKLERSETETKDEQALALRAIIDSVGKPGMPGEHIRCVVSVSMLTEGWDASNVTHILGIRAFGSQLLCEQVVGRGLRRMSYDIGPNGHLAPEYVDVYGIPFSLVPFKGKGKAEGPGEGPKHRVFAMPERQHLEIKMPVVEGYTYDVRDSGITCDVMKLEPLIVNQEPTTVWLRIPRDIEDEGHDVSKEATVKQTRDEYYRSTRLQQIVFRVAQQIVDDLVQHGTGPKSEQMRKSQLARHHVFPSVVKILNDYIAKRVTFTPGVDKRELGLEKYARMLRERVRDGILPSAADENAPLLPVVNRYEAYHTTASVDGVTSRPIRRIEKSHLNAAVIRSMGGEKTGIGENAVIDILEGLDAVEAFAPNDRQIGFVIPYEYEGNPHRYEPDFVVRMKGGKQVLLEVKGGKGEVHGEDLVLAKNAAARKWVAAVNGAKRYGDWAFEIVKTLPAVRPALLAHAAKEAVATEDAQILPFRRVEPKPQDRWVKAVPLVSLRAAAGHWSAEQVVIEEILDIAQDWVEIDLKKGKRIEKGMFVCQVSGRSMEPEIPSGSYCLFKPVGIGSNEGKRVLAWHEGLTDAETGGSYTVKVLRRVERKVEGRKTIVTELCPLNDDFPTLPVDDRVRLLAEVVTVLEARS